ncbi:MAG: hypothetical protein LR008_00760 [Candidatus Pacebacteria bacterium]|nr:hypothetical protein [Candidatus Paceibacterota bacterium]
MNDLGQLSSLTLPLETLVMLAFYFILGAYTIFSAILFYHWRAYSSDTKVTGLTLILYFATTAPLLLILTITALTI